MCSSPSELPDALDVIVIGAGASGLMSARVLLHHKKSVTVLESRNRIGGRAFSFPLVSEGITKFGDVSSSPVPSNADPDTRVDLGCSSIHGVQDDGNSVWNLALHHSTIIPKVLDGIMEKATDYENTLVAPWYRKGNRISQEAVVRAHRLHEAIIARIASYASKKNVEELVHDNFLSMYEAKKDEVLETFDLSLTVTEQRILQKIRNRYYGYCAPLDSQSTQDLRHALHSFDEETHFDEQNMKNEALKIDKFLSANKTHDLLPILSPNVSRRFGADVAPVHGYGTFVERILGCNIQVKFNHIVRCVDVIHPRGSPIVRVKCDNGAVYYAKQVICSVPLGVLKASNRTSSITFRPSLSENKQRLISSFGVGVHNKVILKYAEEHIFWPRHVLQFNCLHPTIQFNNLHALGKKGYLLAHIFGAIPQFGNIGRKSDEEIIDYVTNILERSLIGSNRFGSTCIGRTVFNEDEDVKLYKLQFRNSRKNDEVRLNRFPKPISAIVTRWEDDPFACGSYSFVPSGTNMDSISNWSVPEMLDSGQNLVFFAGEHTVDGIEGWQCAHGAGNSGIRAAYQIITGDTSEKDISNLFQHITYLPHPAVLTDCGNGPDIESETEEKIREMKTHIHHLESTVKKLKRENEALKSEVQKSINWSMKREPIQNLVNNLSELLSSSPIDRQPFELQAHAQSDSVPGVNVALTRGNEQLIESEPTRVLNSEIHIRRTHAQDESWKHIRTPIVDGKRHRARCIHNDREKRKLTSNVCTRCRRFVCSEHWDDGTHLWEGNCIPYTTQIAGEQNLKVGRPYSFYTGCIQ